MGKKSRDKGAAFEREVAKLHTEALGVPCKRNLEEVRSGNRGDIVVPGVPLSIQCKVGVRPPIYEALDEAVAAAREGDVPVAIIRRNRGRGPRQDIAVMPLDHYLGFIAALWGRKQS